MRRRVRIIRSVEDEEAAAYEPLADLLFTMVAILLLAVVVILPALASAAVEQSAPVERSYTYEGEAIEPLIATRDGLRRASRPELIARDDILESALLRSWIADGSAHVLLVAADGIETAFVVESVFAAQGVASLHQIRLPAGAAP